MRHFVLPVVAMLLTACGRDVAAPPDPPLPPPPPATRPDSIRSGSALTVGWHHTCAIASDGAAWCWGSNIVGQLGTGRPAFVSIPTPIQGDPSFSSISAGRTVSCGIAGAPPGAVMCWGTGTDASSPVDIAPGMVFDTVAAGSLHRCALASDGQAHCWDTGAPVPVGGGHRFTSIAVGRGTSCGLKADGRAWCWVRYDSSPSGRPGSGAPLEVQSPVVFTSLTAGGRRMCGLTAGGDLWCWGAPPDFTPVRVSGDKQFRSVSTGPGHTTCGIVQDGRVWCLSHQDNGDTTMTTTAPWSAGAGRSFSMVAEGDGHTCALDVAGQAWCWGANHLGQLGDGTRNNRAAPATVQTSARFVTIVAGENHTCGITSAGATLCWGSNRNAEVADGGDLRSSSPVVVTGDNRFTSLSGSYYATCGRTAAGLRCWGAQDSMFAGGFSGTPQAPPSPTTLRAFSPTRQCGVTDAGALWCVRDGAWQQLAVPPLMSLSDEGGCGLATNGQAWCWVESGAPVPVGGDLRFTLIAERDGSDPVTYCGIDLAGSAWCWGGNSFGQSGNGTDYTARVTEPVRVSGGHRFAHLSIGRENVCGVTVGGDGYCWGSGQNGQRGDGITSAYQNVPQLIQGGHTWSTLAAGPYRTCGITIEGAAYCWARNDFGEMGSTSPPSSVPVRVTGNVVFAH